MSDQGQPAGWYHAEGDPPGTTRYWDGTQWQGGPQAAPVAASGGGGAGAIMGQNLATPGRRIAGRIIDVIILGILSIPFGAANIDFDAISSGDTVAADGPSYGIVLLVAVLSFVWEMLFINKLGGTPGKLILGMRVADADSAATPVDMQTAAKRSANRLLGVLSTIGSLIGALIGLASLVMLFTDDRNQTVMDKIGNTVVIKQ